MQGIPGMPFNIPMIYFNESSAAVKLLNCCLFGTFQVSIRAQFDGSRGNKTSLDADGYDRHRRVVLGVAKKLATDPRHKGASWTPILYQWEPYAGYGNHDCDWGNIVFTDGTLSKFLMIDIRGSTACHSVLPRAVVRVCRGVRRLGRDEREPVPPPRDVPPAAEQAQVGPRNVHDDGAPGRRPRLLRLRLGLDPVPQPRLGLAQASDLPPPRRARDPRVQAPRGRRPQLDHPPQKRQQGQAPRARDAQPRHGQAGRVLPLEVGLEEPAQWRREGDERGQAPVRGVRHVRRDEQAAPVLALQALLLLLRRMPARALARAQAQLPCCAQGIACTRLHRCVRFDNLLACTYRA